MASGDDGPLAWCDACWYPARVSELIRKVPTSVAEQICSALEKLAA